MTLFVYNRTLESFLKRLNSYTKEILKSEMNLEVKRSRFLYNGYLYPLRVVCFEDPKKLGFYDPHGHFIAVNKALALNSTNRTIKNILRHELAHMYCYLEKGVQALGHNTYYRETCKKFGWDKEVYSAYTDLEIENKIGPDQKSLKLISKVQKLMSLASSENIHEAQQATAMANRLLLKHNLSEIKVFDETNYYIKRVLSAKKTSTKLQVIYEILKQFYVSPVFNYGKDGVYLEVTGTFTNVELADYLASFLNNELEILYKKAQRENPSLKGVKKKNSFLKGVLKGYLSKIEDTLNSEIKSNQKNALITINKQLQVASNAFYGRLSKSSYSQQKGCSESMEMGKKAGRNLSIKKGISSKTKTKFLPLFKS